jgi:hypothetical protein
MFYAIPPTIPPSGQFNQLSVTNLYSTGLNNGYFTSKGGSVVKESAGNLTYTASDVAGGVITRQGLDDDGFDSMPTAVELMSELGLSTDDQSGKYVRYLTVYNDNNHNLNLSGSDWSFTGFSNITQYYVMTFVLSIYHGEGWRVDALSISRLDLD